MLRKISVFCAKIFSYRNHVFHVMYADKNVLSFVEGNSEEVKFEKTINLLRSQSSIALNDQQ